MNEPAKQPFTLRFLDDKLESQFLADYIGKSRKPIEIGLWVGLFVYGVLFGIMDWILESNALYPILGIRLFVCLLGAGVIFYGRSSTTPARYHELVAGLIFIAGLGLVAMILLDHSPDAYLDGPVLLILPTYVLFRLRFMYASIVGVLLFVVYCVVIYFVEGMRASDLFGSVIFLFAANLIGMVAGYELENYARKEFWQTRVIDQERKANAELLALKNRFFANISHEIRTPLTLIVGPLDDILSSERRLPEGVARVLATARRSGERLLRFITQLLDLAKVDGQQESTDYKKTNLVAFLDAEVENFQPYAASQGITLSYVQEVESLEFICDYDKLDVIVSNLLSNALKYTPRDGAVRLTLAHNVAAGAVSIEVKDNGQGIPSADLPHIFDRFYRVAHHSGLKKEGLGLGLSLTHAMVNQLGGEISVESEEAFGSSFTVILPVLSDADVESQVVDLDDFASSLPDIREVETGHSHLVGDGAAGDAAAEHDSADGSTVITDAGGAENQPAVILLVEDDPEVRAYIGECLTDYTIVEAASGEEGLKQVEEHIPDLILSDLMMPGMDGRQFAHEIRSQMMLSHIPFIMLTANVSESSKIKSLEEGIDDYLTKPFNRKELQLRVRNILAARRQWQQAHHAHIVMEPSLESVQSSERVFMERLRSLIDERLGEEHFNADALADELGVSVRQLQRKTKALLDETPTALIRVMRLKKAGQLIEAAFGTVSEVAYAVGFNNPTYFTKCFREYFGEAPTSWKKNVESDEGQERREGI